MADLVLCKKRPIVVIAGPTASGKTGLGVQLCKCFGGEVISADSMQIYRGMNIGTAKPTQQEMQGVPHHLIDFLELDKPFSVADYVCLANQTANAIYARGNLPFLVGGTGLYIQSFIDNIVFADIEGDEHLRAQLRQKAQAQGAQALLNELMEFDPQTAQALHPNNLGRIIRAIEVYKISGITMTQHRQNSRLQPSPFKPCMLALNFRSRQTLYERIDKRVDQMLEQGLLKEAQQMLLADKRHTAVQAIGYKELFPYLEGKQTLQSCVEQLKMSTRRYAKRQLSWFRRDERYHWIYADDFSSFTGVVDAARAIVQQEILE